MLGILAFILFVVGAVIGWPQDDHVLSVISAGLAALTIDIVWPYRPWVR
jgi:hypothetical protein